MASEHSTIETHALLSEDAFQNEESRKLFDVIDRLQSVGANRHIDLPELVIVGDQSAGKSSLLQSLTEIPFPVAGNIYTRFPTRIISRRTKGPPQTTISIDSSVFSVFRKYDAYDGRKASYEGFKRTFATMTKTDFMNVVDDVKLENLNSYLTPTYYRVINGEEEYQNFTDDVLKIEISGPDRSQFSILDVPGVFQSLTKNLTDKDKMGVDTMVSSYMASQQGVIICVASGTNDVANQSIFDKASTWDKKGERTIGVITKCDATQHVNQIMDLAENKEKILFHGWFVVRNRTPDEVDRGTGALERYDTEQAFFSTEPWNRLKEDRRGTQALKRFLAKILCERIQKAFPSLLVEIQMRRDSVAGELKTMGVSRKTIEQKRTYLTKIAQDFHSLASETLRGRYENTEGNEMRLRMKVQHANDAFANEMKLNGHSVPFAELASSGGEGQRPAQFASKASTKHTDIFPATRQPNSGSGLFSSDIQSNKVRPLCPQTEQPFQPHSEKEGQSLNVFQSISSMPSYRNLSFEELRLNDDVQATSKPVSGWSFGIASPTPERSGGGLFGGGISTAEKLSVGGFGRGGIFGGGAMTAERPSLFSQPKQTPTANPFSPQTDHNNRQDAQTPSVFSSNNHNQVVADGIFSLQTNPKTQNALEMYQWIKDEIKNSRGTELQGTMNPDVLPILFHKQTHNWKAISERHLFSVSGSTSVTLSHVLQTVCGDPLTRNKIDRLLLQANQASKSRGSTRLLARIEKVLSGHLQTNSSAFEEKVSEARRIRFHAALERYRLSKGFQRGPTNDSAATAGVDSVTQDQLIIDMRDTASLFAVLHISNSQNLEDEIHDTLKAYYDVARDHFVEHVNQEVVEPYLYDPEGSVFLFSPIYIAGLKDEDIEVLAAEDGDIVRKRAEAGEKLARLNQAEAIALEYNRGGEIRHS